LRLAQCHTFSITANPAAAVLDLRRLAAAPASKNVTETKVSVALASHTDAGRRG
jgi:hypothetical protein